MLTDQLDRIRFGGDEAPVRRLSVRGLLPETDNFMTYEGSTTAPACHETVTWIVLNKPIYITKQQVSFLFFIIFYLFFSVLCRFVVVVFILTYNMNKKKVELLPN